MKRNEVITRVKYQYRNVPAHRATNEIPFRNDEASNKIVDDNRVVKKNNRIGRIELEKVKFEFQNRSGKQNKI